MSDVRRCPDHGYVEGIRCPVCGTSGQVVLDADRRRRLSKFGSGALRHFPEDAGIELDDSGWADWSAVVEAVTSRYDWAEEDALAAVVATDPKGRFEVDDCRIRAAYGHSVAVDLEPTDAAVPDVLYHGTAPENVESILADGLRPMNRQLVHLSGSVDAARSVGARHTSEPVVLRVDAAGLLESGQRVTKRGVDVYTTQTVPPRFLDRLEAGEQPRE